MILVFSMAAKPEQQDEEGDHEPGIVLFFNIYSTLLCFVIIKARKNLQGSKITL